MQGEELRTIYKNRFDDKMMVRKNHIWDVLVRHYIQRFIKSTDTVVDIGCGAGEFINHVAALKKIAVDLNPESESSLNSNVMFLCIPATEIGQHYNKDVDVVFTSNFLEHLPDKKSLELLIEGIGDALKPGGKLIVMGPNLRYIPGAYWDYYDHHIGLTHNSLTELLQLKGFTIRHCYPRFLPYTTKTALPTYPFLVRMYLLFPMVWRFFGKQFFIVAESV